MGVGRIVGFILFPMKMKCKKLRPGIEQRSPCQFFSTIMMSRVPSYTCSFTSCSDAYAYLQSSVSMRQGVLSPLSFWCRAQIFSTAPFAISSYLLLFLLQPMLTWYSISLTCFLSTTSSLLQEKLWPSDMLSFLKYTMYTHVINDILRPIFHLKNKGVFIIWYLSLKSQSLLCF